MKFFLLLLFPVSLMAQNQHDVLEAQKVIKTIIAPILAKKSKAPKKPNDFRVDKCERHKIDLGELLFKTKEVVLSYSFKEGCHIEGKVFPKLVDPFPISFNLQKADPFQKVEGQASISADIDTQPLLKLELRSGVLLGKKGKVLFEVDYQARFNPDEEKNANQNLGGEMRIINIYGKKVLIKEKILIK